MIIIFQIIKSLKIGFISYTNFISELKVIKTQFY